jgi:hypothetical protein
MQSRTRVRSIKRRFLGERGGVSAVWILVLGGTVAAAALGGFALERTGVIGSGGNPSPPTLNQVVDESDDGGGLEPDRNEGNAGDGSNRVSTLNDDEADENAGGRGSANDSEPDENEGGGSANDSEPDENDRGD